MAVQPARVLVVHKARDVKISAVEVAAGLIGKINDDDWGAIPRGCARVESVNSGHSTESNDYHSDVAVYLIVGGWNQSEATRTQLTPWRFADFAPLAARFPGMLPELEAAWATLNGG